ncbi:MAG: cyclophilin-like fold protein [Nitrospirota bacterium]|nr:cyclophilin-like fold protein [Nitrospirota bacterium]MDH5767419.1 cyclophilin-like fold protein [Nitrospirota bacterium]
MPAQIKITIKNVELDAEFFDTECAKAIANLLPIETGFNTWGDEFYFEIPVKKSLDETATRDVKIGDIGYWPPGNALCIFFGTTPLSKGTEPVPASEVNLVGRIDGDASLLKNVKDSNTISIERIETGAR